MNSNDLINLDDYHREALQNLSKPAYDYYASGAHDEVTLRRNREAFEELCLYYRVLVDVSHRDLSTQVLGRKLSMPLMVAPTAFHGLSDPEGEVATARAAAKAGTLMTLSTLSNMPLEAVAQAATSGLWFQLYFYKDRGATKSLVERAEAAGAQALVLTVDAPFLGCREADVRNRFQLRPGLQLVNLLGQGGSGSTEHSELPEEARDSGLAGYFASLIENALSWKDLSWLKSLTDLPILVKGIVRTDDALRAEEHGVDGVIVSNHGGRQLDTSPATISALPGIAKVLDGRLPVLLDGGIRRGTDVIKAIALGANAVLIGRPVLWGLAARGEDGVTGVLELFRKEIDLAMALCGTPTIKDIGPDLLRNP
jgi:4-hydroxymandelate oxidase